MSERNWIGGVAIVNPSWFDEGDCARLSEIADMIERDYVRREYYYERVKELGAECNELKAERDGWKAKAEQAEHAMNKAAGNWAKADAESRNTTKQPISQFDVPKSGKTTENSTAKNEIRDFDDTREKLEADVLKYYTHTVSTAMWPPSANKHTDMVSVSMDMVLEWLDRQATITEREFWEGYSNGNQWEMYELQRQVNELTAEREMYREKLSRALDLAHEIERLMP